MQAVILAAGESSRFWPLNYQHKSFFKIMDKPLIWYTIEGLRKAKIKEVIIVQSPKRDVEKELKNYKFSSLKLSMLFKKNRREWEMLYGKGCGRVYKPEKQFKLIHKARSEIKIKKLKVKIRLM